MSMYQTLDALILDAIKVRSSPNYNCQCNKEASRIAELTGREAFRVIDGRLQALRRSKAIQYKTKKQSQNGVTGWCLADAQN